MNKYIKYIILLMPFILTVISIVLCKKIKINRINKQYFATQIYSTVNIDGIKDNIWNHSEGDSIVNIINRPEYWDGPKDLSGAFNAMWDRDNLYLFVNIVDEVKFTQKYPENDDDKQYWRGWDYDSIEIYFRIKDKDKLISDEERYFHYIFTYMFKEPTGGLNYEKSSVFAMFKNGNSGYSFEASIKWKNLNLLPCEKVEMEFEIQINDNDKKFITDSLTYGGLENVIMWANKLPEDYRFFDVLERYPIYGRLILTQ